MTKFYLGTHRANWLGELDVPLFVSHRQLKDRKRLPRAKAGWALDSGAFSELSTYGRWETTEEEYIEAVQRYQEIGKLEFAAPMDWMCEPFMLERTGLSVQEHQRRTVENYLRLRDRGPFIPVLQGWEPEDYRRCIGMYEASGIDLYSEPVVGVGTVCKRQDTASLGRVLGQLEGIRIHGFGIKITGIRDYGRYLASADSMAWSYAGRRKRISGHSHKTCANCKDWALQWRQIVLGHIESNGRAQAQTQLLRLSEAAIR